MIKKLFAAALVAAAFVVPSQVGAANAATSPIFPASSSPYGQSYGKWNANWWQQVAAIPADLTPLLESGPVDCNLGKGKVVFLVGTFNGTDTRSCTVPKGTALLLPLVNTVCTQVAGDGDTVQKLTNCAASLAESVGIVNVTVDGKSITGLKPQFRFPSGAFTLNLPAGSIILDDVTGQPVPAGPTLAAADGYYVMLTPLTPGVHTLTFGGDVPGVFSTEVTYQITVK